ncbi:MAG: hypothetical protein HS116_04610 [Planctomycetes bacterium]|nr:hypothetical protein [Planctomycetota bacterium]
MGKLAKLILVYGFGQPIWSRPKDPDERLGGQERWELAAPLMMFLIAFTFLSWVIPKFEQMYLEMGLGTLPPITSHLFEGMRLLGAYPALLTGGIFVAFWTQLGWASRKRWRACLLASLTISLTLAAVGFMVIALFLPMICDMERMGP